MRTFAQKSCETVPEANLMLEIKKFKVIVITYNIQLRKMIEHQKPFMKMKTAVDTFYAWLFCFLYSSYHIDTFYNII